MSSAVQSPPSFSDSMRDNSSESGERTADTQCTTSSAPIAAATLLAKYCEKVETWKNLVVIIGGGAAGLSAANEVLANGGEVLIVEKNMLGGNSAKATSGVNAVNSKIQREQIAAGKIHDDYKKFFEDTFVSSRKRAQPELVNTLVALSGPSVDVLTSRYGLDLSDIQFLGGHSARRTHRFQPKEGRLEPFGWTVVRRFTMFFNEYVKKGKANLMEGWKLVDLEVDQKSHKSGLRYNRVSSLTLQELKTGDIKVLTDFSAVIISTGGYAADSSNSSIIGKVRPDLIGMPTTNGNFSTGDAIKIAEKHNIKTIDLMHVQIHPTGFLDRSNPTLPTKFLCPEVVRGLGAIMVDKDGKRFIDELLPRDEVSDGIHNDGNTLVEWKLSDSSGDKQRVALLIMNDEIADAFGRAAFGFYMSKGLIFKINDVGDLRTKVPALNVESLLKTAEDYNRAARREISDVFGKTNFPRTIGSLTEPFYVAFITPSIHFTMGGLAIDTAARAMMSDNAPIMNLYVAGETAGGVHGANRLGGNGCLQSFVFGQLSGTLALTMADCPKDKFVEWPDEPGNYSMRVLQVDARKVMVSTPKAFYIPCQSKRLLVKSAYVSRSDEAAKEWSLGFILRSEKSSPGTLVFELDEGALGVAGGRVVLNETIRPGDFVIWNIDFDV